ncbi:hypothetical protein HDV00_009021 [Rhizophlyctis rosea]|nr:hypothetical protein HDV00_009021 [Rhizophlyctis rosea]
MPIWMDCASINQNDKEDVSSQVAIMGRIYSDCKYCVIYDEAVFKHIQNLVELFNKFSHHDGVDDVAEPAYEEFRALQASEYFGRAWTYQEWMLPTSKIFASPSYPSQPRSPRGSSVGTFHEFLQPSLPTTYDSWPPNCLPQSGRRYPHPIFAQPLNRLPLPTSTTSIPPLSVYYPRIRNTGYDISLPHPYPPPRFPSSPVYTEEEVQYKLDLAFEAYNLLEPVKKSPAQYYHDTTSKIGRFRHALQGLHDLLLTTRMLGPPQSIDWRHACFWFNTEPRASTFEADQVAAWAAMLNLKYDYNKTDSKELTYCKVLIALGHHSVPCAPHCGSYNSYDMIGLMPPSHQLDLRFSVHDGPSPIDSVLRFLSVDKRMKEVKLAWSDNSPIYPDPIPDFDKSSTLKAYLPRRYPMVTVEDCTPPTMTLFETVLETKNHMLTRCGYPISEYDVISPPIHCFEIMHEPTSTLLYAFAQSPSPYNLSTAAVAEYDSCLFLIARRASPQPAATQEIISPFYEVVPYTRSDGTVEYRLEVIKRGRLDDLRLKACSGEQQSWGYRKGAAEKQKSVAVEE